MKFRQEFKVFNFECDPWQRMTPGSILRRGQEIATEHCEKLGINDKVYEETKTAFLLSRISLKVNKMPEIGQLVQMETRAYAMVKAVYTRITSFYNEKGDLLCEMDGRWLLVNTQGMNILRRVPDNYPNPFTEEAKEGHDFAFPKFRDTEKVKTMEALYSMCDKNMHINNTRYADIACDLLPLNRLERNPVKRMVLHFRSEIALGSCFDIFSQTGRGGEYYFLAKQEDRKSFECYIEI